MKPVINTVKIVVGIILLTIGLIGGLIPIFQGWVFGIPGLMLLEVFIHRLGSGPKK